MLADPIGPRPRFDQPAVAATPKISVCLPTYNRAHYLKDAIESMLAQSFRDFELIVADNCSTDATADVVERFRDSRIRYVRHDENIGHYRNMNRALELARGRYVCIAHDDDIYAPEFLASEARILDEHPAVGMVHCAVRVVHPDRQLVRLHRVSTRTRIARGLDEFCRYLGGHDVCCSTVMCRRELWTSAGPFEHRLMCADWLMWLNMALRTDIAYIAEPLVDMRQHASSMTSTMDPQRWYDEFVEVTERAIDRSRELRLELNDSLDNLRKSGCERQSRRFLIAAVASAADDADEAALAYVCVLDRLKVRGARPVYSWAGRLLVGRWARPLTRVVRTVRRSVARARTAR